jgi:hypothetical protein
MERYNTKVLVPDVKDSLYFIRHLSKEEFINEEPA